MPSSAILKRALWAPVVIAALLLSAFVYVKWTSGSDFSLSADRTSVAVGADSETVVAVKVASKSSSPAVRFTIAHAPGGISLSTHTAAESSSHVVVLTLAAAATTRPGTYPVSVVGTSGSFQHTLSMSIAVHTPPPFTFVMRPAVQTIESRGSTGYSLLFHPGHNPATPVFTVTGLPTNATYDIVKQDWVNDALYRLYVHTTIDVAPGSYLLNVHIAIGSDSADAQAYLVVTNAVVKDFTISGDARNLLSPGRTSPINLAISNTFKRDLTVTGLTVGLVGTSDPSCATSNFQLTQYSGPSTLTVPAHSKKTLLQLGVPVSAWPKVTMVNLSNVNQDACKNVTLNLTYSGSGSGT